MTGGAKVLGGCIALVTGASSGIGAAVSRSLAGQGATVVAVARRADRLRTLAEDSAGRVLALPADITDRAQAATAVATTIEWCGRLDILVNNAGVMLTGPVAEAPPDEWDRMLELNVTALLDVSRAAIPHLVDAAHEGPRGVADLVNISSTAGRRASPGNVVYSMTKFGVNAFTEGLRQELRPQGVRVSVVEPGTTDTELLGHVRPGVRESFESRIRQMELLRPDDVAEAATYIITRPRRVSVNEILVRATDQQW